MAVKDGYFGTACVSEDLDGSTKFGSEEYMNKFGFNLNILPAIYLSDNSERFLLNIS
jgi:hypothetical protein